MKSGVRDTPYKSINFVTTLNLQYKKSKKTISSQNSLHVE